MAINWKRGSSSHTSQQLYFGYLCPVLAACILATRPVVFVNKSLSSWPQRLIKGQHRRRKTTEVTLLIAEKHFNAALKNQRKMKALGFAVLLSLCISGEASGVQVTVSKFFSFKIVLFSLVINQIELSSVLRSVKVGVSVKSQQSSILHPVHYLFIKKAILTCLAVSSQDVQQMYTSSNACWEEKNPEGF